MNQEGGSCEGELEVRITCQGFGSWQSVLTGGITFTKSLSNKAVLRPY